VIRTGPREFGDRDVRLREITMADAPDLYRWRMDDTSRPMFRSTEPVPYDTHLGYLGRYFEPGNTDRWFVIEEYGAPVGSIVLYDFDLARGEAEWGRLVIAPELRSRGLASRGLSLLVRHAREIGLRRLRCEVLAGNAHAGALYRKAGFRETGVEDVGGRRFVQLVLDLDEAR
jgi:RimJ/RimL family protein N-acetyltransferase